MKVKVAVASSAVFLASFIAARVAGQTISRATCVAGQSIGCPATCTYYWVGVPHTCVPADPFPSAVCRYGGSGDCDLRDKGCEGHDSVDLDWDCECYEGPRGC